MSSPDPVSSPRAFLQHLLATAIAEVQPSRCVPADLPRPRTGGCMVVVGGGKAAAAMAAAVEARATGPLRGLVVTRDGYGCSTRTIEVVEAAHPVPDARGAAGALRIMDLARQTQPEDLLLVLLSGGASSLLAVPAPGVTLDDKRAVTRALLRAGASIVELNCVRKHLSGLKGGRLALAAPAHVVTLAISDVVGDDPAVIASGPTVPDPSTCAEALAILRRYDVPMSAVIRDGLESGALETPKHLPRTPEYVFIGRPQQALAAAATAARRAGLAVIELGDACEGEARTVAADHARLIAEIRNGTGPARAPCVVLSGGELTVKVTGQGRGGPNTEYALALAAALQGAPHVWALAADTDGMDGNADAAGAIVTPTTLQRAQGAHLSVDEILADNDSARLFEAAGDLVVTGPTQTNVNDFRAILVLPPGADA